MTTLADEAISRLNAALAATPVWMWPEATRLCREGILDASASERARHDDEMDEQITADGAVIYRPRGAECCIDTPWREAVPGTARDMTCGIAGHGDHGADRRQVEQAETRRLDVETPTLDQLKLVSVGPSCWEVIDRGAWTLGLVWRNPDDTWAARRAPGEIFTTREAALRRLVSLLTPVSEKCR